MEKLEKNATPGDRLRMVRSLAKNPTQEAFGKALGGFTQDQISRVERDESPIPPDMLRALVEQYDINTNWLLTGEGEIFIKRYPGEKAGPVVPMGEGEVAMEQARLEASLVGRPTDAFRREAKIIPAEDYEALRREVRPEYVPLLAATAAGPPSLESDKDYPPGWAEEFIHAPGAPRGCFALRIRGESMAPDYPNGAVVLVGASVVPQEGEVLAVVFFGADADRRHQMKMISRRGKALRLRPLNPHYREEEVPVPRIVACLGVLCRLR